MSYIEKTLTTDEVVVSIFSIHKLFYVIPAVTSLILIGIAPLLKLVFTEYGLTNKRIVVKTGIIGRSTEELKLSKVETVELRQSILGRIFGFGDVVLSGTGASNLVLKTVSGPIEVKRTIDNQLI
ncbi:MAG: PH domain-containing protein [Bacteroidetes bacterium]|jgi:uncharacterized membrane protein YdbT with pleckstrin-like domain|nr:PH domain-containing protein [Bacteroidota bacterium]|tara:strand:+ start:750 stop:1124 length:375 start_codon:yes stop_codon:yes gene_type:complete